MTRNRSKYEQAWRDRAGRSDVPSSTEPPAPPGSVEPVPPAIVDNPPDPPAAPPAPVVPPVVEVPAAPDAAQPSVIKATFESSNIREAELDVMTNTLTVSFRNGGQYRYGNFTPAQMAEWQAAPSAGSWFHHNVRTKAAAHPVIVEAPAPPGEVANGGDRLE